MLKTRPDYAVTVHTALVGFVELKAPGKGGDPRKFREQHDRAQWGKLRSLPNVLYTDGNAFSLWQAGELVGAVVPLVGDIETSGKNLAAPSSLLALFESFLKWQPLPPRSARELAQTTARYAHLAEDSAMESAARIAASVGEDIFKRPAADTRPCNSCSSSSIQAPL